MHSCILNSRLPSAGHYGHKLDRDKIAYTPYDMILFPPGSFKARKKFMEGLLDDQDLNLDIDNDRGPWDGTIL